MAGVHAAWQGCTPQAGRCGPDDGDWAPRSMTGGTHRASLRFLPSHSARSRGIQGCRGLRVFYGPFWMLRLRAA